MDNKFLILVEGDSDIVIISTVLSHLLHNEIHQRIHFYKCNGYYNMLSSIRPFLDSYDPSIKILATFDADTASIEKVKEKIDFVKEYVNYNYYKDPPVFNPNYFNISINVFGPPRFPDFVTIH